MTAFRLSAPPTLEILQQNIMRIKKGFELRDVCGEQVVIASGIENVDFSQMIALNESAAYLWQAVENETFDTQKLASLLCKEYEVDAETALADAEKMVKSWQECGVLE